MLLLVVLSLLVLFMLIGTAFMMSSSQYKTAATASAKLDRVGNFPTKLLDRALMQVLRDTDNTSSVVRSHSLLRDLYGSEGFEAMVYSPIDTDLSATFPVGNNICQLSRYATPTNGSPPNATRPLGPTQGQLIDIYVREHAFQRDDRLILGNEPLPAVPDARNIIKLERGPLGTPVMYNMPLTKGYFNGCLLTVTSGAARGQSTRIVDYEYIGDFPSNQNAPSAPAPFLNKLVTRLFRFRVMAFPSADGSPLRTRSQLPTTDPRFRAVTTPRGLELADLVVAETRSGTEITGTTGATIVVNGRPFNGTGAGFNELAKAGEPRLNAVDTIGIVPDSATPKTKWLYPPVALLPNASYFFAADPANSTNANEDLWGVRYPVPDPTDPLNPANTTFPALNPTPLTGATGVPLNQRSLRWKYQTPAGPGDADESYDAPDYQNMALAMQSVTPRARARIVQPDNTNSPNDSDVEPDSLEIDDPDVDRSEFLRLDLEDLPLPSFHRPDLVNFWYHQLLNAPFLADELSDKNDRVRAIVGDPAALASLSPAARGQLAAMKRKFILRPLREDHPNFDGSNPASRNEGFTGNNLVRNESAASDPQQDHITIPFWEAVGPWDVDNDNDGVRDSVWVDLGDPVTQAEDGTLYKPLYAFLIVDLDGRLNVNAHGLVDDLQSPLLDPTIVGGIGPGNLAHDLSSTANVNSSNFLAPGSGYGPADISLRPIFPLWDYKDTGNRQTPFDANRVDRDGDGDDDSIDNYATLLAGRAIGSNRFLRGRFGLDVNPLDDFTGAFRYEVSPGITSTSPTLFTASRLFGPPDRHLQFDRFDYPTDRTRPSSFSNPPDMMGRYAVGLDYTGQPVVENAADVDFTVPAAPVYRPLLADSPYELDLSGDRRRDARADGLSLRINQLTPTTGQTEYVDTAGNVTSSVADVVSDTDDAPFATAELERLLRAYDADSGILPDRLWDIVSVFDPLKLMDFDRLLVAQTVQTLFRDPRTPQQIASDNSSQNVAKLLAAAQQMAGITRREVTTDSYDLPVPGASILSRLTYGADGRPGVAWFDSNGDGVVNELIGDDDGDAVDSNSDDVLENIDEADELGWQNSDDWYAVMYRVPTPENPTPFDANGRPTPAPGIPLVPAHPTIVDLFNYRVQYERWKIGGVPYTEAELRAAAQYLLPPEVIAGKRMDLNRPFGDGRDNGDGIDNDGNGLIDDSLAETNPSLATPDTLLNGIVDEPEEAGEPFIDTNGNGKFDVGEYFYDLSAGGTVPINDATKYNGPRDTLWQGLAGERIFFNYTFGGDVTDGRLIDGNSDGDYDDPMDGRVRFNGTIQRQTYARHLYCLMMLLVDEEYVASQNMRPDGQGNVAFLDSKGNFDNFLFHQQLALEMAQKALWAKGELTPSTDVESTTFKALLSTEIAKAKQFSNQVPAYQWMLRKLSARRIAQWAINCVDYRDADSIMTPFEYDENPFDGWGCTEYDPTTGQITLDSTGKPRVIPLDNDIATNENWGNDFPAPRKFDPTRPINTDWTSDDYNVDNDLPPAWIDETLPPALQIRRESATREVVWGTERPELLITETLALHDRRATDEEDLAGYPPHRSFKTQPSNPTINDPPDFDLDQKQKPRGSLFVELYNPWPADGGKPAELYGAPAGSGVAQGVMLNRLSTLPDSVTLKRSPVWRMTVLYDPFTGKLSNQVVDPRQPASPSFPSPAEQAAKQVVTTDPDGFGIDLDQHAERFLYFTTGDDYATQTDKSAGAMAGDESDPDRRDDHELSSNTPGAKADYQEDLATGKLTPEMDQLSIWVPPLPIRFAPKPGSGSTTVEPYPAAKRYFIARTERHIGTTGGSDRDIAISPILPGRFAVVGSSGIQLNASGLASGITTRFVTPISQLLPNSTQANWDERQRQDLLQTRRIELWPNPDRTIGTADPNHTDPNVQQILVGENGGPEFVRADLDNNGVVSANEIVNVTDSQVPGDGRPDYTITDPCVAIPVEDLNVSEPVEGYPSLFYQRQYLLNNQTRPGVTPLLAPEPVTITADGEYVFSHSFDRPLDMEYELTRNGTTQNYRTLHLQRLANPSLPWNPPPFDRNGKPTYLHRPWLPVNPYLTIDSQSVDLTAYNSSAEFERSSEMPIQMPMPAQNLNPQLTAADPFQGNYFAPLTPEELYDAPDHVLWALIFVLKQQYLNDTGALQPPLIDPNRWVTPADIRADIENNSAAFETNYLEPLTRLKGVTNEDRATRSELLLTRTDGVGRQFTGQWCWHMFRRVLPDDATSDNDPLAGSGTPAGSFRQWMNMKSLERGSQDSVFYAARVPYASFYSKYDTNNDGILQEQAPMGWTYDPTWTPRMLWQQTRPNARIFLRTDSGIVEASDLKNTNSRRLQETWAGTANYTPEERDMRIPDDEIRRNRDVWSKMRGSMGSGTPRHVVDYVVEQTLGFVNSSFAPELDRYDPLSAQPHFDANALMPRVKPGAPEVAVSGSRKQALPQSVGMQDPDAILLPDNIPYSTPKIPKEMLNAPKLAARVNTTTGGNDEVGSLIQALADASTKPAPLGTLAQQDLTDLRREFYARRQRLMKSTYPWLAWNDRPFISAEELMQVPAWSSSQMLREYTVANAGTSNVYHDNPTGTGSLIDDGSLIAGTDVRVSTLRYAAQQAPYGHLLNYFLSALTPARVTTNPIAYSGAPKYYRLLDFVEVPSRFVGTQTMLSPEIFNDVPNYLTDPEVGTDIPGPSDPRFTLQPPFNRVSRERDPGRVNLNTVIGRRTPPQPDASFASGFTPPRIRSDVFDGIMHRYGDSNLLANPGAINPTVVQLGHFGPAWRDVALSRRGYPQYNADVDVTTDPPTVESVGSAPDVFAFGLNRDYPSMFSNPFRSADAGDLVPLDYLVRPGVDATLLRGQHWLRADDNTLRTNPFASVTPNFSQIAWGEAGVDDDRNGIVDDVTEAGFGDSTTSADSDPLYVVDWTNHPSTPTRRFKTLKSSSMPLFSEQVPEPSIDGERNPAMMYQPMTRLGNLVTTRSNVYAIWVTVGYFEVEKAPDWNDPNTTTRTEIRARFGATTTDADPQTIRGRALYDRVYPDGYMLGEELGTDTGNSKRERAFYIIDRTEPVGFKPGEDLNVDKMIRVRRRIE